MKRKITNPFITGGYLGPEYFCDRLEEAGRIMNAISSRRNLTLISLRRMGKTGLLKHIKFQLEYSSKKCTVIYVDLLPTTNGNEMLNALSTALYRIRKSEKNFIERLLTIMSSLRPKLTIDPLTGEPSVEFKVESSSGVQSGLEQILKLISEIKQDIVFMFDEFQQISKYPEQNIESLLRTVIQSYPSVPFIFSGSSRHMLENMFMSPGRPFYQSSELMYLDRIKEDDYRVFIKENFNKSGREIDDVSISKIFDWTRLHTYYVQYVCNHLYGKGGKKTGEKEVKSLFHQILTDFEPQFVNYRNLLPPHQFRLLQAIGVEDGVLQPTSGDFIRKHDLTSPSSVMTSLKALTEKEMIVFDKGKWQVHDVFLSRWLEYHYRA
ncbi:MAG: ATP-binding protein [Bacteroidales bacterium]|nr:ATP-binding protein [Bacteroidales bacterium]